MFKIRQVCYRVSERKGQSMTEYALLLAGIAVIAFAGYSSLGASTNGAIGSASQLLSASNSGVTGAGAGSGGAGSGGNGGGSSGHHHDGHHHHHRGGGN